MAAPPGDPPQAPKFRMVTDMPFLFWLGMICLTVNLAVALVIAGGIRRMTQLAEVSPLPPGPDEPRVSIIIPACNEAATIEPALRSVLALEYGNLEIIAVDDRSTDDTGQVLARLAREEPRLQVYRIDDLPEGWLGKNHALQFGADRATGDYLLFTDADVQLAPTTLSRAIHHLRTHHLDHLSVFFENIGGGGLLNSLFLEIGGGLLLLYRPWRAKDPYSRNFMGVGAFNLVNGATYRAIGGHRRIAMHPIDDVMLGKLLKRHGGRQDCLLGNGFVAVPWYGAVREFVNGLMKNTFAAYDYRVSMAATGVLAVVFLGVLPPWGLLLAGGLAKIPFAAAIAIRLLSFAHGLRQAGLSPWRAGWALLTPYLSAYITVKAVYLTLRHHGICWRGTHFPLA